MARDDPDENTHKERLYWRHARASRNPCRRSADDITIYKSVGVGLQDVALAHVARTIEEAARFVPRRRLIACTNCGLAPMKRAVAEAKLRALAAGAAILCDARMVAEGVTRSRLPAANRVICTLNEADVPALATELGNTRSAVALEHWREHLEGSVVVIGNAPTALFYLLEMLDAGAPKPALILADEPTGNVDPPMARRLLSLFLELNRLGTAVVIATHDLALMDQVDARRMILTDGRLDIYE